MYKKGGEGFPPPLSPITGKASMHAANASANGYLQKLSARKAAHMFANELYAAEPYTAVGADENHKAGPLPEDPP